MVILSLKEDFLKVLEHLKSKLVFSDEEIKKLQEKILVVEQFEETGEPKKIEIKDLVFVNRTVLSKIMSLPKDKQNIFLKFKLPVIDLLNETIPVNIISDKTTETIYSLYKKIFDVIKKLPFLNNSNKLADLMNYSGKIDFATLDKIQIDSFFFLDGKDTEKEIIKNTISELKKIGIEKLKDITIEPHFKILEVNLFTRLVLVEFPQENTIIRTNLDFNKKGE